MLPEGVVCRRATPEDHRAVVGIRTDALFGTDYMDWEYPFFMSSPSVHGFVLERDGIMMAFIYAYIVDGGRSIIRGGGRTREGHGGKKYMKILKDYLHEQLQKILIQPARYIYIALESGFHLDRLDNQTHRYTLLLRQNITSYTFRLKNVRPNPDTMELTTDCSTIWRANEEEFIQLMQREDTTKLLFPNGYLISDRKPYAITEENSLLISRTSVIHVSGSKIERRYSAISFSVHQLGPIGLIIHFDFFGNPNRMKTHVLASAQYLASGQSYTNPDLQVALLIHYPEEIDVHDIDSLGHDLGWNIRSVNHPPSSLLVAGQTLIPYAKL